MKCTREEADDTDDALTDDDEDLVQSKCLFFKEKNSWKGKSKVNKKKKESSNVQSKEGEILNKTIKSQMEAAQRAEEEKIELFE